MNQHSFSSRYSMRSFVPYGPKTDDYIQDTINLLQEQIQEMERDQQQLRAGILARKSDVERLQAALAHPGNETSLESKS